MKHETSSFLSGCGAIVDAIFCAKELDKLAEADTPNSSFFAMHAGKWMKYDEAAGWPAISMATVRPANQVRTVVAIGPKGQFWEVEPKSTQEWIGVIEQAEFPTRSVRAIGNEIYLCGMGRMVLKRQGVGKWVDAGPNAPLPPEAAIGFEDIAGYSEQELYAVGWQGEIWWRDGNRWRSVDSPVSANLNAIICAPDGNAYAVGDGGVMLKGRHETWQVFETGRDENLMDVGWHGDQVYTVTDFRILRLKDQKLINDGNFADPDDKPATCLHLFEVPGAIFSMGPKDLFRLKEGATWERLV